MGTIVSSHPQSYPMGAMFVLDDWRESKIVSGPQGTLPSSTSRTVLQSPGPPKQKFKETRSILKSQTDSSSILASILLIKFVKLSCY